MGDRTLCKLKGSKLARDPEAQRELILDPAYICEKCGRVAHSDRNLCHSTPLADPDGGPPDRRKRGKKDGGKDARKKNRKKRKKKQG